MIVLLIHQIWFVYMKFHQINKSDQRLWIFGLCLVSEIYTFFHYGIVNAKLKGNLYFINEIFRFLIMFSICYYYINKASGLLENRKFIMRLMKIWAVISVIVLVVDGGLISKQIVKDDKFSNRLCTSWLFELNRLFSLSICPIFWFIYIRIRKAVLSTPRETDLDKKMLAT